MKLTIKVNPATSLAAGYEPVTSLDLDLAPLSPDERSAIAGIMEGTTIRPQLATPTVEALIAAAMEHAAVKKKQQEIDDAAAAAKAATLASNTAVLRDILDRRPTITKREIGRNAMTGATFEWDITAPDLGGAETYQVEPTVRDQYYAWRDELAAQSHQRMLAARDAANERHATAAAASVAARSKMAIPDLIASLPEAVRGKMTAAYQSLVSDDGRTLVLSAPTKHPAVAVTATVNLVNAAVEFGRHVGGDDFAGAYFEVSDGVVKIPDSSWAAVVTDPSAVKPRYQFLDRCPGGYQAPSVGVGDVIVWGSKDKKGRKLGPYDRLVYAVDDAKISVIKCDYATARRLRKLLLEEQK